MEIFEIHKASRAIEQFVIDDFSNWYLRRSRKRLWIEEETKDKKAAYAAIYEIFVGLTKVIAPFTPFIAEEMYQNLRTDTMQESVHLCDYPPVNETIIDENLECGMQRIRDLVEVGRALRSKIGIKVRYPLASATIVCEKEIETSLKGLIGLLMEELNVKEVLFQRTSDTFMDKLVKPNFAVLGPRLKEKAGFVQKILTQMDMSMLFEELQQDGNVSVDVNGETIELSLDDFEIQQKVKDDIAETKTDDAFLFLDIRLTQDLEAEGFAREIVRRIQSMRKEIDLAVESQITTVLSIPADKQQGLSSWVEYIKQETRSISLTFSDTAEGTFVKPWDIDDMQVIIGLSV